jgi:hypothetical protein
LRLCIPGLIAPVTTKKTSDLKDGYFLVVLYSALLLKRVDGIENPQGVQIVT